MQAEFKSWERQNQTDKHAFSAFKRPSDRHCLGLALIRRRSQWEKYSLIGNRIVEETFKKESSALDHVIEKSRFILSSIASDEAIPEHTEATWKRATNYLRRLVLHADIKLRDLPLPRIVPADQGSIDLLWKSGERGLLINFPPDGEKATYYGKKAHIQTSGVLLTDDAHDELIRWLTEYE